MTPLDTELFNEFKRLDKLLKESRDTERGVSDYIDDMKKVPLYESNSIPDWDLDLDRLWYCRHFRNKLAHDTVSEDDPLCDPEDAEFLKNYIIPMKKMGTTQDIADAVVFLCSDMAGHITGMAMPVCGGMQM